VNVAKYGTAATGNFVLREREREREGRERERERDFVAFAIMVLKLRRHLKVTFS